MGSSNLKSESRWLSQPKSNGPNLVTALHLPSMGMLCQDNLTACLKAELDLLPGLGGQMQDPEVLVVVELFSTGGSKQLSEDTPVPQAASFPHKCWDTILAALL